MLGSITSRGQRCRGGSLELFQRLGSIGTKTTSKPSFTGQSRSSRPGRRRRRRRGCANSCHDSVTKIVTNAEDSRINDPISVLDKVFTRRPYGRIGLDRHHQHGGTNDTPWTAPIRRTRISPPGHSQEQRAARRMALNPPTAASRVHGGQQGYGRPAGLRGLTRL